MSATERYHQLARQTLFPHRKPGTYLKKNLRYKPRNGPVITAVSPSIFPHTPDKHDWKTIEHRTFDIKVKHVWKPNYRHFKLPVTLLAGLQGQKSDKMMQAPMKLRIEELRDVEEAGGLEAKLLSTPGKDLSDHGKLLRHNLFQELIRMRDQGTMYSGPNSLGRHAASSSSSSSTSSSSQIPLIASSSDNHSARLQKSTRRIGTTSSRRRKSSRSNEDHVAVESQESPLAIESEGREGGVGIGGGEKR